MGAPHRFTTIALAGCTGLLLPVGCFFDPSPPVSSGDDSGTSTGAGTGSSTGAELPPDSSTSGADAASSDGSPSSTAVDETDAGESTAGSSTGEPAACDRELPFAAPTALTELDTSAHEDRAWLSHDELTIYLSSNRDDGFGGYDIYTGVRDELDQPFGELTLLTGSVDEERAPSVTADGLTMYVGASPVGAMAYDIVVATREDLLAPFSVFAPVGVVNGDSIDNAPSISADGSTLYFESNRAGSVDIYRTEKRDDGPFAAPDAVDELNSASEDGHAVPTEDGLTIYFSSNRVGGVGDYDVWVATRTSTAEAFESPSNVAEVSSDAIDWPTWISPDGCRLYVGSRRPDGGDYDLWLATRGG